MKGKKSFIKTFLLLIKSYIKMLYLFTRLHIKSQLEYKKSFFLQVFGMILNNAAFLFFWLLLFNNFKRSFLIKGIDFSSIALIWGLSASSFGLLNALFGGFRLMPQTIIEGKLDNYLLYPKNTLFLSGISKSDASAWGDLIYGYILFFIFLPTTIISFFLFTYFIILAVIFFSSVLIVFSSLTFFIGNSEEIKEMVFHAIISFSTYPEKFFSGPLKFILFTFIPVGLSIYLPVRVIMQFDIALFLIATTATIACFLFSIFVFKKGLKRYESANIIVMQG